MGAGGTPSSGASAPKGTRPSGPPRGPSAPPPGAPKNPLPPSAAGEPPNRKDGGPSWGRILVIAAVVVVAVVGGALGTVLLTGDDESGASEVTLEPAGDPGENPYLAPVGTDQTDVTPPDDGGGTLDGSTPGLYGGTQDQASCDADQLISFLEDEPDKAEAWAEVLDLEVSEIADYVKTLTPLVLRSDTAVTNHGYRDGEPTSFPAVLQAGTAVLVTPLGEPVVKCGCGNPLTPYDAPADASYEGLSWAGFQQSSIAVVEPASTEVETWYVVDPATNEAFGRPVGTDGSEDGPAPPVEGEAGDGAGTGGGEAMTAERLLNIELPDLTAEGGLPGAQLVDGVAVLDPDPVAGSSLEVSPEDTYVGDFTGDGIDDGLVGVRELYVGANAVPPIDFYLFAADGTFLDVLDGSELGGAISFPTVDGTTLTFEVMILGPNDPRCCPSVQETVQYEWNGTEFVRV